MNNRIAILVVAIVAILGVVVGVIDQLRPKRKPIAEDLVMGRKEVREAFRVATPHQGAIPEGISTLFTQLGNEFRERNGQNAFIHFDVERMAQELDLDRFFPTNLEQRAFVGGLRDGLVQALPRIAKVSAWNETKVQALKWYTTDQDAVVITKHTFADEFLGDFSIKMRWWLIRQGDEWKVYDFEDVLGGFRFSMLMGMLMKELNQHNNPLKKLDENEQLGKRVRLAREAIMERRFDDVDTILAEPIPENSSQILQPMYWLLKGVAKIELGQSEEAKKILNRPEMIKADIPGTHLLRARIHNDLEEYEEAIVAAQKYLDELGPDGAGYFQLAKAQFELNRTQEALDSYRKGFDETPNSPNQLKEFRRVLEPNQKKEFAERFTKLSQPESHFVILFSDATNDADREAAELLVQAFRTIAPDHPQGLIREGELFLMDKQPDEAMKRFDEAINKVSQDKEQKNDVLDSCVFLYFDRQGPVKTYEAFAKHDPRVVFRTLCFYLLDKDDPDEKKEKELADKLEKLLAEHRKRDPKDPWIYYAQGEIHLCREENEAAERTFAEGVKKVTDQSDKETLVSRRVEAMCRCGKGIAAYESIDSTPETFERIAFFFERENKINEIAKLLEVRRKKEPKALDLVFWQGRIAWLKKDYAKAAEHYLSYRDAVQDPGKRHWSLDNHLLRSLIRSKQFELAHREIDDYDGNEIHSIYRAVLYAIQGNAEMLETELGRLAEKDVFRNERFHYDEDLGPQLRDNPQYRKLLEKYPVPKGFQQPGKPL